MINIGHPEIVPIEDLAERIRARLGADPALVTFSDLPSRMTLIKRPSLERQRDLLGVVPTVSLDEGIDRVCSLVVERVSQ